METEEQLKSQIKTLEGDITNLKDDIKSLKDVIRFVAVSKQNKEDKKKLQELEEMLDKI